ncbi:MAG: IncP-type conjugal transfer protein TraG [Nitrospirae bacterium]|nr:IncP-type conjugal transfer protein TraG [Nitrospirota bacterium]
MQGNRILILTAFTILIIIFSGIWASTQWAAYLLAYQPQLGAPLFTIAGQPVYFPWKWFTWNYFYYYYAPRQFTTASIPMYVTSGLAVLFAIIASIVRSKRLKIPTSHGSARWATEEEIKTSGLLSTSGVFLAQTKSGQYLRHGGPEHLMIMAPTRSGKGVGLIIPTLFSWLESAVITDIKGENWAITSGFRKKLGHRVIKFDPCSSDGTSAKYNPLLSIRVKTLNEVRDCQNVGEIIVDPMGTGNVDHWGKTGLSLLVAVFLHILYQDKWPKTLPGVASMLSNPEQSIQETFHEMLTYEHDPTETIFQEIYGVKSKTHPKVAEAARELLNKSENELSGVVSTAMSFLGLYRDPIIARNTSESDFTLAGLMNFERPVSLYLVIPPSDIQRTIALIRMILNQLISRCTEEMRFEGGMPVKSYKWRLLLLLDEFPAFGRIDSFERQLAYIAGYGIKAFLICQSQNQLNKAYGQDNSIMDNCHIRVFYKPNDPKSSAMVSRMLGTSTQYVESHSYRGSRLKLWLGDVSHTISEQARPLLTEGEMQNLPDDEVIIFSHIMPIRCKKIVYYKDHNFKDRPCEAPKASETTVGQRAAGGNEEVHQQTASPEPMIESVDQRDLQSSTQEKPEEVIPTVANSDKFI